KDVDEGEMAEKKLQSNEQGAIKGYKNPACKWTSICQPQLAVMAPRLFKERNVAACTAPSSRKSLVPLLTSSYLFRGTRVPSYKD
ncbi:hypothetical protein AVEN_156167-1, partial [Araneus ventricosus]